VLFAALAAAAAVSFAAGHPPTLLLTPCDPQGVPAGCGTLRVPENRARPGGRTIGLHVVVVPARHQPSPADAFTYLSGGPGGAATQEIGEIVEIFAPVHEHQDIVLVDQRGTGSSHPLRCPPQVSLRACVERVPGDLTQYGSEAAADDLDAVREALGYAQLDVYGVSYGATLAQVYLKRHRGHVRTLVLDGATFLDVPFYDAFAQSAQRALDRLAARCAASPACARAYPRWRRAFTRLVHGRADGNEIAGIVQQMLLDPQETAKIPYVVARAAAGDMKPLRSESPAQLFSRQLMFWSVWCNEPWVGLQAAGPWHTDFDGFTQTALRDYRRWCAELPRRPEPAAAWTLPRTQVPLLVLAGGADPQDPLRNVSGLRWFFPNARAIVVPEYGHGVAEYGCVSGLVSLFVDRASAGGLDARCVRAIRPPPFVLPR